MTNPHLREIFRADTANARAARQRNLETAADPDRVLSPAERQQRVDELLRAHLSTAGRKGVEARRARRARRLAEGAATATTKTAAMPTKQFGEPPPDKARLRWEWRVGYRIPGVGHRSVATTDRGEADRIARFARKHWRAADVRFDVRPTWVGSWATTDEDGVA